MGTSQSYGGRSPEKLLLPQWALGGGEEGSEGEGVGELDSAPSGESTGSEPSAEPNAPEAGDSSTASQADALGLTTGSGWSSAKGSMTRYVTGGGGSQGLRRAGKSYVSAAGGSRSATGMAKSGRQATAGIGNFLASASRGGFASAVTSIGLVSLVGKSIDSVFSEIADVLAPAGSTREDTAARKAVLESLYNVFEKLAEDGDDLTRLDSMSQEDVTEAILDCVSVYIYTRWLEELGLSIEKNSTSEAEAVRLEREVKQYVEDCVRLDTKDLNVVTVDWEGQQGQQIIEQIFNDAYSLLEDE